MSRKNIGEADRLLTAFSEDFGKIRLVARGSRRIKSKLAPHIEPFLLTNLEFVEGKTFYVLTGAERAASDSKSFDNLDDYRTISYLYELTDLAFQEREPSPEIFNLLSEISRRDFRSTDEALVCRYFELKLLSVLGFRPDLFRCKKCGKELLEREYYTGDFEGLYCDNCKGRGFKVSKNALKALRLMSREPLNSFLKVSNISTLNPELEKIITPYLYEALPRKPRSLQL